MNAGSKYVWVPFFQELADKVLSYKNNRGELLALIRKSFVNVKYAVYSNSMIDMISFVPGSSIRYGSWHFCILTTETELYFKNCGNLYN